MLGRPSLWRPEIVRYLLSSLHECTCNVGMIKMSVVDPFFTYDRSFFKAISTPNNIQKAEMILFSFAIVLGSLMV